MTLEAEPVSPGEALSGKLSGKLSKLAEIRHLENRHDVIVLQRVVRFG